MSTNPFDRDVGGFARSQTFVSPQARVLASQQRALASIGHSEQVGVSTLEELSEQGEKLDRAEERLHQIGELQKDSQKQINSLNSWWRSWFTKKPAVSSPAEPVKRNSVNSERPVASYLSQNPKPTSTVPPPVSTTTQVKPSSDWGTTSPKSQFDANMDVMSSGVARLKDMARAMNAELKAQNQQLDRMDPLLSRASDTITTQNRQMNKLLGVKSPRS